MKQVEGAGFYATRMRAGQIGPNLPCHAPPQLKHGWSNCEQRSVRARSLFLQDGTWNYDWLKTVGSGGLIENWIFYLWCVFRCIRKREEKSGDRVKEMNKKYRDEHKSEASKCTKTFHREGDCLICKRIRHVKSKNHLLGWAYPLLVYEKKFFPRASEQRVLLIVGVCQTFSPHLHIFPSHLEIFTSSHPHIFSSSHLVIFTSSHLHILSSSHLLIFTSSHLHICSSSHLLIFTSSHLHIFSSSHPHILTSAHLHFLTSSHLLIFTSAYLLIFSSSHLHIFTFSLALLLSCPLALSFFSISLLRRGAVPTRRHETQPFRTKRCSIAKNCGKIAILKASRATFRTKWGSIAKYCGKIAILKRPAQPFCFRV